MSISADKVLVIHPETGEVLRHRKPWMRESCQTVIVGESMTHQSFADETDVNAIVARFERTGIAPPAKGNAQFGDVTDLQSRDFAEHVMASRATIDTAVSEKKEIMRKAKEKENAEFEEFKKAKQAVSRKGGNVSGDDSAPPAGTETPSE